MDQIYLVLEDGFSFDDIYQITVTDEEIVGAASMAGNLGRVKLVVIRALQGLVATGMLRESAEEPKQYFYRWHSDSRGE